MPTNDNSAARLYSLLGAIKSKSKLVKPSPNKSGTGTAVKIRVVLADVSGNKSEETVKLYLFLSELANLAQESIDTIQKTPDIDHKAYIKPLEEVKKGLLSSSIDIRTTTFSRRVLTDINMMSVRFCADMLSTVCPETVIPARELASIRKEIETLLEDVVTLEMPDSLKAFLIDNLEKMRQAVLGYQVFGNQGIKKVLESIIGATFFQRDQLVEEAKDGVKKKALERFFSIIEKTTKVLSLAEKVKTLSAPAISLLLPP